MDDFPSEFDLIVVGTGFSESIIAAAASRVGKSVLHIDENDYYCGFWASFNFDSFVTHLDQSKSDETMKCRLRNCEKRWFDFSEEQAEVNGWSKEKILKETRRFNIDLLPKVKFNVEANRRPSI
jgi:Rab proteins geranylgeranyltransferase component A